MSRTADSRHGFRLSLLMKLVALIALNMAFLRARSFLDLLQCDVLFALVMMNLAVVQYFILGRRLGAFHCTFLVVGLVASLALSTFCGGSWGVLRASIGPYLRIPGRPGRAATALQNVGIADRCLTSLLVLVLAWAAGLWMASASRRQPGPGLLDRPITSFFGRSPK